MTIDRDGLAQRRGTPRGPKPDDATAATATAPSTAAMPRPGRVRNGQPVRPAEPASAGPPPQPSLAPVAPSRNDDVPSREALWLGLDDVHPSPSQLGGGEPVIGYVTIGTEDPVRAEAPSVIRAACRRAGWELLEIVHDRENAGRAATRPGLEYALAKVSAGDARALVISDSKHLTRSIVEFGALMEWFSEAQAVLIALDLGVDTSTWEGQFIAAVLGRLGQWEHERIARRTRRGLSDVKARGGSIGRPTINDRPGLRERIAQMRLAGMTLQAIADELNADGVPTVRGGALWRPSSVQTALGYQRPNGGNRQRPFFRYHDLNGWK
jgi:DNA invertase Pin-like site-specific DNA recombinase